MTTRTDRTGEVFDLGPTRLTVVAATDAATVLLGELEPGAASGWHVHTREDETIVLIDGTLVVADSRVRRELSPGDAHVLPRGTRHVFANEGDAAARAYFVCTPGGLERFFRALAEGTRPEVAAEDAGLLFG